MQSLLSLTLQRLCLPVLVGLSLSSCATKQPMTPPSATSPWPVPPLSYYIKRLPEPPRPGSFRDRVDLEDAIAHQKAMTHHKLAQAQVTYVLSVFSFSQVFGPEFTPKNYPLTAAFFKKLSTETGAIVSGLKDHYKRERPFFAHPEKVTLYVRNEPGYSFPSGHTTRSRLYAFLLADLDPARRTEIYRFAEQVAFDRILAGEHYQTDLEAGRKLGKMLFEILQKNPQFQKEFEAVREAEWKTPPKGVTP